MSMCHAISLAVFSLAVLEPFLPSAGAQPNSTLVSVTREQDSVVVKTAADTLRLTVCSPTVIHVLSSPDGSATGAAPSQPWIVEPCSPHKFTLTIPTVRPPGPTDFDQDIPFAATLDTAPIELRVYPGANAGFDLYEDAGDSYDYEKGAHSVIPIQWDDREGRLTIGARVGEFPGMARQQTFRLIVVRENHGGGSLESSVFDREIKYSGETLSIVVR